MNGYRSGCFVEYRAGLVVWLKRAGSAAGVWWIESRLLRSFGGICGLRFRHSDARTLIEVDV